MSKTFKLSAIFLITVVNLQIARIIFSFINLPDNFSSWLFSFVFQVVCMGLVPYLLYRFWIDKDDKMFAKDLYLKVKIHPMSYALAILVGLLVFYLNTAVSAAWYVILNATGYTYVSGVSTIYSSPEVLVFEIITTAMLPAIFEELTDRGLLLAALNNKSDKAKILIVGLMFGILHQNIAQLTPTMFGGLVMAFMAVKSGSIFPSMIVHFINNFLIVMLNYSRQIGGYLNAFYSLFVKYYSSNIILAFFFWGIAGTLLYYTLKQFAKINKPPSKIADKQLATELSGFNDDKVVPYARLLPDYDDFEEVFGLSPKPTTYSRKEETMTSAVDLPNKKTVKWWEYGLLYCAIFTASLVTIFTYIWGLLR